MPFASRSVRLLMVASAAVFAAAAFGIRAVTDGQIGQYSGAALSGSIVYTIVVFVRPPISPLVAGGIATAYCWFVEFSQLTGIPAALSERSVIAQLLLGTQFDIVDVAWYPVGVVPLVALHWFLRTRSS
ncbi:hypothetical protein HDA40_002489 [Hamadaea flava]|uniref:DUF2809 domain-containing protein n=1 Tax=Hamadaea flava TaxID=1742688 RepID=A0ABV8LM48_9ACTN|nr:DUF2809 domain-containing protein [Hamadaea flava]MCP2323982.1 hypothetical protein [Hamadaea flava]